MLTKNGEPESYSEALRMKDSIQATKAMEDELRSLDKNQTWSLVKLPAGKKRTSGHSGSKMRSTITRGTKPY